MNTRKALLLSFVFLGLCMCMIIASAELKPAEVQASQPKENSVQFLSVPLNGMPSSDPFKIQDAVDQFAKTNHLVVLSVAPEYMCNHQAPQVGCVTFGVWVTYQGR